MKFIVLHCSAQLESTFEPYLLYKSGKSFIILYGHDQVVRSMNWYKCLEVIINKQTISVYTDRSLFAERIFQTWDYGNMEGQRSERRVVEAR